MCKSMFSLFCLDNLFLPLQKPVQEQRDTQEPHLLTKSFVFAVADFPRTAQQALQAVFGSLCYPNSWKLKKMQLRSYKFECSYK